MRSSAGVRSAIQVPSRAASGWHRSPCVSNRPSARAMMLSMKNALIGAALAAIAVALGGCGQEQEQEQEPAPAVAPSAASTALEPLIRQYADLERKAEDDESDGPLTLHDVSSESFEKELDSRRQLLEQVRQIDASGLSREEDIDRRLMIGLLESTIHTAEARRVWENDASLYV